MATAVADTYSAASGATLYGGRTSGVPAWLEALAPRQWAKLGNGLAAIDPRWDSAVNPLYIADGSVRPPWGMSDWNISGIFAYSGGCMDPDGTTFYQWGGGHGDSGNNGVYALDLHLSTPTWRAERHPAGSIGNWDGVNALGFDGLDSSVDVYYNGEPRSAHTYNGPIVAEGKMWSSQGYKAGAGGIGGETLFWYDLVTRDWHSTPMPYDGILCQDLCYIPPRRTIMTVGKGNLQMGVYHIATDSWTQTDAYTNTSNKTRLVYIPTLDVLVGISAVVGNGFFVHDFGRTANGGNELRPALVGGGALFDGKVDLCNGNWVPSLGCIVGWSYGADFWTLTPPASGVITDPWTEGTLEADAGNTVTPIGIPGAQDPSTFGRLFFATFGDIEVIGLSTLENSGNAAIQPYFFRL